MPKAKNPMPKAKYEALNDYSNTAYPVCYTVASINMLVKQAGIPPTAAREFKKYLEAAAYHYCWIPVQTLWEIIQEQNPGKYSKEDFGKFINIYQHTDRKFYLLHPQMLEGKSVPKNPTLSMLMEYELFSDAVWDTERTTPISQEVVPEFTLNQKMNLARDVYDDLPFRYESKKDFLAWADPKNQGIYRKKDAYLRLISALGLVTNDFERLYYKTFINFKTSLMLGVSFDNHYQAFLKCFEKPLNKVLNPDYITCIDLCWEAFLHLPNPMFHGLSMLEAIAFYENTYQIDRDLLLYACDSPFYLGLFVDIVRNHPLFSSATPAERNQLLHLLSDPNNQEALKCLYEEIQKHEAKVKQNETDFLSDFLNKDIQTGFATKSQAVKNTQGKIGRNAPCPCGSGKKYKNCCGKKGS